MYHLVELKMLLQWLLGMLTELKDFFLETFIVESSFLMLKNKVLFLLELCLNYATNNFFYYYYFFILLVGRGFYGVSP